MPVRWPRCCRAPMSACRTPRRRCGRSSPTCSSGARRPRWTGASASTAYGRRPCASPPKSCRTRSRASTRTSGQASTSRSTEPAWCTTTSDGDRHHGGGARRHGHRAVGAGGASRPVRARRPRRVPEQRRHERGPGPGRRRRVHRGGSARRSATTAACRTRDPRCVRTARRRRGVRRRRRAGDRDVRLRRRPVRRQRARRSTWSPAPATSTSRRPSACCGAYRHRLRGRADRDRGPRRRHAPTPRTSPPTSSARPSTTRSRRPCSSRRPPARRRGRGRAHRQVAATKHIERITEALSGPQSAIVLVDDLEAGLARRRRLRRRAPRDPERDAREWAAGAQRGCDLRRRVRPGVARRLRRRLQPRAAHRRLAWHSGGLSVQTFLRGVHVVEYDENALRDVAPHVVAARPRRGPARPRRGRRRPLPPMTGAAEWPLLTSSRSATTCGAGAVRRAAARRPGAAQRQREPLPAIGIARRRHRRRPWPTRRAALNRYPDRDALALRADLADVPRPTRASTSSTQVWAANGSNEVMHQLFLAFGGPGRTALSASRRRTRCTRSTPATPSPRGSPSRGAHDFTRRPGPRARRRTPSTTRSSSCSPRRTTRPAPRSTSRRCGAARATSRPGWSSSTRRTPSSAARAHRARSSCCTTHPRLVVTRTMSKAFALRRAGGSATSRARSAEVVDAMQIVRLPYHLSARHAGGRAYGARARRRAARRGGACCAPSGTHGGVVARQGLRRRRLATRTSCCSAGSTTVTRCGRVCSPAACSSGRPDRTAGCV